MVFSEDIEHLFKLSFFILLSEWILRKKPCRIMENRFLDFMISHKMNFKPFEKNYSLYECIIFNNHYLLLDGI